MFYDTQKEKYRLIMYYLVIINTKKICRFGKSNRNEKYF